MARPIRMAPVLYGEDAEYFYEAWQKSLDEPDPSYPSKERQKEIEAFILKNERRKLDELARRLSL